MSTSSMSNTSMRSMALSLHAFATNAKEETCTMQSFAFWSPVSFSF